MKKTNDALRADYVTKLIEMMTAAGEEVLRTKSNEIAIPVVDADGEDNWVVFSVKVPVGSRDGDVYDGYGEAESYAMACQAKAEKAKKAANATTEAGRVEDRPYARGRAYKADRYDEQ